MKIKTIILSVSSFVLVCSVWALWDLKTSKSKLIGQWSGTVKTEQYSARFGFSIESAQDGTLIGKVDSFDGGIKGIPLSKIEMENGLVKLKTTNPSGRFEGKFSENNELIQGNLYIAEAVMPMDLTRGLGSDFKFGYIEPLSHVHESEYFVFYSTAKDAHIADILMNPLDRYFHRITDQFKTDSTQKITVYIYPNIELLHLAYGETDSSSQMAGFAGPQEIHMSSELRGGIEQSSDDLVSLAIHEFSHNVMINLHGKDGVKEMPKWLDEGFAFHEAKQMNKLFRQGAKGVVANRPHLTWRELDQFNNIEFGRVEGYPISASIIEYLIESYGYEKLTQLILSPNEIDAIYGESVQTLENNWRIYMENVDIDKDIFTLNDFAKKNSKGANNNGDSTLDAMVPMDFLSADEWGFGDAFKKVIIREFYQH